MNILGIWDGHDSGAALLQDGALCVALNEERLSRRKLEIGFPTRSIQACLDAAHLTPRDVHIVAASTTDPAKTLGRWWPGSRERYYAVRRRTSEPGAWSAFARAAKYRATVWPPGPISKRLSALALRRVLRSHGLPSGNLMLVEHHEAHAAAAAWASTFSSCAVLTVDGVGDGVSTTISAFRDGQLTRLAASPARHSIGVLFEHVTNLLNMRELEDEGKVMALADYAAPVADENNPLLDWVRVRDGIVNLRYTGATLRNALARVHWRFPNEQLAYMAQRLVERTCVALARDALRLTGSSRLALAGGVMSNVKATRHVRLLPEVDDLFVFPHMGDGGLAVGAATVAAAANGRVRLDLGDLALGHRFDTPAMSKAIVEAGLDAEPVDDMAARVATHLEAGHVVMWFQGGMEYGPRALGHRSVLARPDRTDVRDRLNLVLKRRVWYQPFCPSMLESEASGLLADCTSTRNRWMTMAYEVAPEKRALLAGAISVDGTCRPHFVADSDTGEFATLLRETRRRWGAGVVLNTSFNIHGEPLVCTPEEAVDVFRRSGADVLAIGPFLVTRAGLCRCVDQGRA